MTLLNAAITNLNVITDTFNITLLASEIDDDHDVEVDYGDVLLFRSALYTLKSAILIATAYNLDIDLRELVVLGNAGILQIQRDILDKYSDFLDLRPADGVNSLTDAKQALLNGIDAYKDAFNFITTESDLQENDLFYFELGEDQRGAEFVLTQLMELRSSLVNNQIAEFIIVEDTWILTDGNGKKLQIEIEKDVNGNFVCGHACGLDGCDFLFCSGWVEEFAVSSTTVTIKMGSNHWCGHIFYTLTGTAQYTGDQLTGIESGSYSWTDCDGVLKSGTFTATRQSRETEIEKIDFNLIFGNTNKSPLDIKDILPEFDENNLIKAGTFPGYPVLNGIFPEISTEKKLLEEKGLDVIYEVPFKTITLDGSATDWTGITSVINDGTDENAATNADIKSLYVARDNTYLYWMLELHDPSIGNNTSYTFSFGPGDIHFGPDSLNYESCVSIDGSGGVSYQLLDNDGYHTILSSDSSNAAVGSVIEARVPLSYFDADSIGSIHCYSYDPAYFWGSVDFADSALLQFPAVSISGIVTCSAHDPSITSKIFIYARDALTGRDLGETYITSPGTYTITGLPAGVSVNLFARWDADDNGIKTFLDYLGETGPITVADGETTVPEFSINTLIDDSYIMTKPGLYRVFGSNIFSGDVYGGFSDIDWGDDWTFIGEGSSTETFTSAMYYEKILIIWDKSPTFRFDSFEDLTANTAFAVDESGSPVSSYSWSTSNLSNPYKPCYTEPFYFKGYSDGLYAVTGDWWYGYSLFTMPSDSTNNTTTRQLKITLVSNLVGDLNGDNNIGIADAIHALRVVSNYSDVIIDLNFNSDINGNGRIGLEEAIYALQHSAELRTCETRDIEDYMYIEGHVYVAGTSNSPVQGAVVSTSLDSQTATTDANGHFFLQTNTLAEYSSTPYTITISASGYQTYSVEHTWGDHPVDQVFTISQ
ncbi:MAG: hypothetical protein JRE64_05400 [Deltaproteobacteria bacterium]|nr:hypothetical protein [Deltaproteobacteria bacterium]